MSANEIIEVIHKVIELAALVIELLAVAVIIASVLVLAVKRGTVRYIFQVHAAGEFENYKHQLGKALLLGTTDIHAGQTFNLDYSLTQLVPLKKDMSRLCKSGWSATVNTRRLITAGRA